MTFKNVRFILGLMGLSCLLILIVIFIIRDNLLQSVQRYILQGIASMQSTFKERFQQWGSFVIVLALVWSH